MIVAGLMSGTSADGVDCVLMNVDGAPPALQWSLHAHQFTPYPSQLQQRVLACTASATSNVELVCALNVELGGFYADCVRRTVSESGLDFTDIKAIGCHGQTVWHIPQRATLQIGEPAVIAEQTGISVVSNFRSRDIAAGGHGAPLVAYVDQLLFSHATHTRALQNLGGIGNVTWLPNHAQIAEGMQPTAFDTGPANMLMDEIARIASDGALNCDVDGRLAAAGHVHGGLLEELLAHPFFAQRPPKTTGREVFGRPMALEVWARAQTLGTTAADLLATLAMLTAASIADAYREFLPAQPTEVFLSGGGARNPTLVNMISQCLTQLRPNIVVRDSDALRMPVEAKEAACFAILAHETIHGRPGNLPGATGARRRVVLGDITPA